MKILVADDARLARKKLVFTLEAELGGECSIIQAENGQEAVAAFAAERPEIVFLDLTMPVMTGYEALERIMAMDRNAFVVVVSADVQEKAVDAVRRQGAWRHVSKPISPEAVREVMAAFRQRARVA